MNSLLLFYSVVCIFGIYLFIEGLTFGKWRSDCFLQRVFSVIEAVGQGGKAQSLDQPTSEYPEGYHVLPGAIFSIVGAVGVYLSEYKPQIATLGVYRTSNLVSFTILLLVVIDSAFWFFGLNRIHECMPAMDGTLSFGEMATLAVYFVTLMVVLYAPSFISV